ncbi:tumor necrosis factor ligand superfamily member 12 isoform X7 [Cricetulus griseus]|uniref:Tumor necrosis factor ligand superfamily member 12 isoform X7 n=1 Tax=Cricetulus griseus TaxID=10029 RepID=A0A9J7H130_CRIGR|nr:tumor necrosis factor ligand superfamily member 12 isoform X7 [Cricetulus griseus]
MAARRSQRRRGRRGEPGTALLAPLVLSLGLALACLGLLLVVVSLGSWATLSAQQEPSQEELTAEDHQEPPELNPQTEGSQDGVPFLERLVRPRRSAPKGRKVRARRAIAAHYEVHPRPGQEGAQAELQSLRKEVSRLQRSGGPSQKRGESPWQSLWDQVLFHDVTFTMGQVVSRESQGSQETLFRCIRSMPSDPDRAYNSCYSAGVFHLHQGDILTVKIPRANAKLSLSPHGTFLGFVKL